MNLLDDLKPRAITRDLDWGVPVPLDGWRDRTDKRLYVWFDAVIGYLSASIEWAARTGDPDAWRPFWQRHEDGRYPDAYYFMGKDNIVFHAEIWPAMLFGYSGIGAKGGAPGRLGALERPYEVVSSEFLTMEGRKFSSSRNVVIYVGDMLARYSPDALRYYLAVAGPENQDTDFTWSEFLRRNNDELVGRLGQPGQPHDLDDGQEPRHDPGAGRPDRRRPDAAGVVAGRVRPASASCSAAARQKAGHRRRDAGGRRGEQVPVRHGALEAQEHRPRPHGQRSAHRAAGGRRREDAADPVPARRPRRRCSKRSAGRATWAAMPELVEVDEETAVGSPSYAVLTGDYQTQAKWESVPLPVGRTMAAPTPVFTKLDPSIVDEELERLAAKAADAE